MCRVHDVSLTSSNPELYTDIPVKHHKSLCLSLSIPEDYIDIYRYFMTINLLNIQKKAPKKVLQQQKL